MSRLQCPDPSPSLLNGHPQPRPVAFDFDWGGRETSGLTSSRSPGPQRQTSRGSRLLKSDPQGLLPSQAGPPPQVRARAPAGAGADLTGGPQGSVSRRAPHFCPVCLRAFPYLSDLERHSISHSELKPHECKDCGKTFKRSSHLRRHCNIHAGLRPFCCQLCPRRFREAGELAHHHRVHSGERPYQCPVCWLRFTEANTLRRHSKRKHPEALGMPLCPPDPRPETPWDEEEGIPATAGVCEEGPEGKEPACPAPSASASRSWLTARSSAGTGPSVQRLHRPDRSAWDSK
ncbi:Hypothetical predicted protein [Marmota monax]|uniref:Zinc finger protein 524 n=1 Tax=Marmota monax TaxID=9995 RepID=A0A5E4CE54_MARMO|nr:Hypothetical predicted protein [Marmota monax]